MIDKTTIANWIVLVVDDEPDSLDVVRRVLTFHGAIVYAARTGREAIEVVENIRPTIILSDLSMPDMDGWEMLRWLQAHPETRDIPVIALTAHAMLGDRERVLAAGFHNYLTKPLSPFTFLADLLKLFQENEPPSLKSATNEIPPQIDASQLLATEPSPNGGHHAR